MELDRLFSDEAITLTILSRKLKMLVVKGPSTIAFFLLKNRETIFVYSLGMGKNIRLTIKRIIEFFLKAVQNCFFIPIFPVKSKIKNNYQKTKNLRRNTNVDAV